jgi:ABC-type multidrug transport system permease subunit
MESYISAIGGYLTNPNATAGCSFCPFSTTNTFLKAVESGFDERCRSFGIMWVYVIVNVGLALFLYWLIRVPKSKKAQVQQK